MDALKNLYNKELSKMFAKDELFIELYEQCIKENAVFIPKNVPSLKNNKQIISFPTGKSICCNAPYVKKAVRKYQCTQCGMISAKLATRPALIPSKRHKQYVEDTKGYYLQNKQLFKSLLKNSTKPYLLGLYFIRKSKNNWDYDNAYSTVADLMTSNGYIDDDNIHEIKPVFLGYIDYKEEPGVIITILKDVKYEFNNGSNNTSFSSGDDNPLDAI